MALFALWSAVRHAEARDVLRKDLSVPQVDGGLVFRRAGDRLLESLVRITEFFDQRGDFFVCEVERKRESVCEKGVVFSYQVVEDAGVERLFEAPAVPELLVVVVEALPVHAEVLGAVVVDVVEPVSMGQCTHGVDQPVLLCMLMPFRS